IMGLQSFCKADKNKQWEGLWQSTAIGLGTIVILFLCKSMFSFSGPSDSYFIESYGPSFVDALISDRKTLYSADLLRSAFLIILSAGTLWMFFKNKLAQTTTIILVGVFMIADLFFVDKKYVSAKDFVSKIEVEVPFQQTPSDTQILRDTTHYRVFEVNGNFSSARASYFHKSIGGYSAVKPRRMQQLFDYQIAKNNMEILNMLNVKYVIQTDKEGKEFPTINPNANGNAWFVNEVKLVNNANDEMKALDHLNTKKVAVFNLQLHKHKFKNVQLKRNLDTTGKIQLRIYKPNYIKYISESKNEGLAVFSEIYYEKGWNAYVDGVKTDHFPVDYVLRGMMLPAGVHTVEFKFEPEVIKTGSTITLISAAGMLLLLVGGIYYERKKGFNIA
ncbi:MAG TPA: YfhO family protein, partial [Flavobacterium sp.]|nr:YfhO family protein [Flavobacterium sp.]